jgi:hypothetical protein
MKKIYKLASVGIIIILALALLIYLGVQNEVVNVPTITPSTSFKFSQEKISYSTHLQDIYASEGKQVTLQGTLKRSIEGSGNAGLIIFSIMDDEGNQILLEGADTILKSYLPKIGDTKELYSAKGTFGRNYQTLYLVVDSINSYERPKPVSVISTIPTTELNPPVLKPKYPLIRNIWYTITGKEIICTDGTKFGNCAIEKPIYCSLTGLTENPDTCGCPIGQKIHSSECILENSCSGIPEYLCSTTLNKQCVQGKFVFNADLCGCPKKYVKNGNNCVKECDESTSAGKCPKLCPNSLPKVIQKNALSVLDDPSNIASFSFNKAVSNMIDTDTWNIEIDSDKCYAGKYRGQYPEKVYCDDTVVSRWEKTSLGTINHKWYVPLSSIWNPIIDDSEKTTGYKFEEIDCDIDKGQEVVVNKEERGILIHVTRDGTPIEIEY